MIQISLPYIYELSASLRPLSNLQQDTIISDSIFVLMRADSELNLFLTASVYSSAIKAARPPGMELLAAIRQVSQREELEAEIGFASMFNISQRLEKFETVLTAELNIGNAYWVSKKRGYDTSDLILNAEVLFAPDLVQKVPEAIADVRAAGKCIAFELATAAGFHLMRATEVVLRCFWDSVTDKTPRPKTNNIGDYLAALDAKGAGDAKTRATLRQIKNLHRNELIHPEVNLSLDEALGLLGITQSAMVAMLAEIPGPSTLTAIIP